MTRLLPWVWLGFWAGALVLTHMPIAPRESTRLPHLDKAFHAAMYFTLCFLGGMTAISRGNATSRTLLVWAFTYGLYGFLDEWTQPWFGREADVLDWIANMVGVGLATAVLSARFARGRDGGVPD